MKNIIQCLFTITVLVTSTQAYAGSTTIVVKDGNSVSQSYDVTTDGAGTAGNFLARSVICDQATGSTCASVSGGALSVNVSNASPNGAHNTANSPTVNCATDQCGQNYVTVAASSTTQTLLQSGSGATGDFLSFCTIYPTSTSPGAVTVFDSTSTATNNVISFPVRGASSVSNLVPFNVAVGAVSKRTAHGKPRPEPGVSIMCGGHF